MDFCFFVLFSNRSFKQLIECENNLREKEIFVSRDLNAASAFVGIPV